ncbi:MAG: sugar ABC transporter substrate-binding protein [Bacteroidota bacterium]
MKILYYVPDVLNPFWNLVVSGIEQSAKQRGVGFEAISANHSDSLQNSQVKAFKEKRPDAILISPLDMKTIDQICPIISEAGIPIVVIDQYVKANVTACIISGNLRGGTAAGKYFIDQLSKGGRIVHIQAEDFENAKMRRKSFINKVTQQKDFTIIKTMQADGNRNKAYEQVKSFLREGITFNGLFGENDAMALGAIQALKESQISPWPIVVGFDGVQEALDAIREGSMSATIAQDPVTMGKKAFEVALNIIQKKPYEELTTIMPNLVTRANLS